PGLHPGGQCPRRAGGRESRQDSGPERDTAGRVSIADAAHQDARAEAGLYLRADQTTVEVFTLSNANGLAARITNYGGIIMSLLVPDKDGRRSDVVVGFETPEEYAANPRYLGAIVGRYANRIADARFRLDGRTYPLAANNGPNSLHGGVTGFDKRVWRPTWGTN